MTTRWTVAMLLALGGCATTAADGERGVAAAPGALLASRGTFSAAMTERRAPPAMPTSPTLPTMPTQKARAGLVVTTMACWYPAGPQATPGEVLPRIDPKLCHTVSERVVVDGPADAATLHRVESLTVQDVALKLEALTAPPDEE